MNGIKGLPWFSFKSYFVYAPPDDGGGTEDETKEETKEETSLDDKLKATADKVAKGMKLDENGKKKDEKKDDEKDEKDQKDDDEKDTEDELNAEQLLEAKKLFKVLNNPNTALDGLKALIGAAGLKLEEGEKVTKKEQEKVTKTIKEFVKERLGGKPYEFLAEDLGDMLEGLFKEYGENSVKEIKKDLNERREKEIRSEVQTAYESTLAKYENVDDKILNEVLRIQNEGELVLGPKTDASKYFKAAFHMAAENLGVTLKIKASTKQETTRKKADATISNLNSQRQRGGAEHKDASKSSQNKTLDEIIRDSAEKVEAGLAKS